MSSFEREKGNRPTEDPVKLLIAEDNEDNIFLLRSFLKGLNLDIDFALNGQEALGKFSMGINSRNKYDIIFMDLDMPVMDGFESVREIRKIETIHNIPRTPIVALTAFSRPEELSHAQKAGCDLTLAKPVNKEKLVDTIRQFVGEF